MSRYFRETNITTGKQSDNIDVSSYSESFTSSGITVPPLKVDAKTQAPYSGFDSDKIAIPSPFLNPKSSIRYLAIFLDNNPKP